MVRQGIFYGTVKDGKLHLDDKPVYDAWLGNLEGKRLQITLENEKENWSLKQFRYLYSCVYQPLAEATGHTVEEIDGICKHQFLVQNKGKKSEWVREKSKLSKAELAEFIDKCIMLAAEQGVVVLPPDKFKD
jgi:hypothetical protein